MSTTRHAARSQLLWLLCAARFQTDLNTSVNTNLNTNISRSLEDTVARKDGRLLNTASGIPSAPQDEVSAETVAMGEAEQWRVRAEEWRQRYERLAQQVQLPPCSSE